MSSKRSKGQYDGKIAGLYDLENTIGRGHFAVVKLARHVFTGEKVAVKVIDKTKLDEVSKAHLFQEVRCMKLVQHPNVVRLYEVIDTQTKLYLILELGDGGDMYDYIMKHDKGLDEETARRYFNQIVQAIHYCHKLHVVHRDLKPENVVFFEKPGIVKLTDFGFSNKFVPGRKLETSCGSLAYSAPEILLGDSYDAPAVDVWSLGVILYMLVCGEPPFQEANDSETLTMIMDCKYRMPTHVSSECQNLISLMLVREPRERAALEMIMTHAWLQLAGQVARVPFMPLISRESLPPEDHEHVLQKMVDGKIATMEEIIQSLESDSYNHITATYYLLAERRLRRHHELQQAVLREACNADDATSAAPTHTGSKTQLAPLALSPRSARQKLVDGQVYKCTCEQPSDECPCVQSADMGRNQLERAARRQNLVDSLVSPPGVHPSSAGSTTTTTSTAGVPSTHGAPQSPSFPVRRCSLIQEECIEEDDEEMEVDEEGDLLRVRRAAVARSAEDVCDTGSSSSSSSLPPLPPQSPGGSGGESGGGGSPSRHGRRSQGVRPLHTVRSSPQLLNQIFEEGESDDDDTRSRKSNSPRLNLHRKSIASPEVLRKYEQRKKRLTSAGSRGTSCSSSDASDTDETDSRKRKEKLKQKFHRRDSSDHSSDTDGPGGPPGGPSDGSRRPFSGNDAGRDQRRDNNRDNNRDNSDRGGGSGGGRSASHDNRQNVAKGAKERRHSIASPGSKQSPGTKRAASSAAAMADSENLPQLELGRRISTLSVGSNLSNLSLASLNARSSKYLVEASANKQHPSSHAAADVVDVLNEENKARTRIIHVRSKEFSDLRERFSNSGKSGADSAAAAAATTGAGVGATPLSAKLRRRSKDRIKTDINRNGLIARTDGGYPDVDGKQPGGQQGQQDNTVVQSGVVTTKCCSLV